MKLHVCKLFFSALIVILLLWNITTNFFTNGTIYFKTRYLSLYRNVHFPNETISEDLLKSNEILPIIFVITPTYYRLAQRADLIRVSHTLRLVRNIHWIVVEDFPRTNPAISQLLESTGLSYTHLAKQKNQTTPGFIRGADQRNAGLDWITSHYNDSVNGVVYFADDDNTYSTEIFEQMRFTKKVSIWPVAFSGGRKYETPIIKDDKIVGFSAWNEKERKFPVDMAGFAINAHVLWKYQPMRFRLDLKKPGFLETSFLEQCCKIDEFEPMADHCTKECLRSLQPQQNKFTESSKRRNWVRITWHDASCVDHTPSASVV